MSIVNDGNSSSPKVGIGGKLSAGSKTAPVSSYATDEPRERAPKDTMRLKRLQDDYKKKAASLAQKQKQDSLDQKQKQNIDRYNKIFKPAPDGQTRFLDWYDSPTRNQSIRVPMPVAPKVEIGSLIHGDRPDGTGWAWREVTMSIPAGNLTVSKKHTIHAWVRVTSQLKTGELKQSNYDQWKKETSTTKG
jgi:hypothetical protein